MKKNRAYKKGEAFKDCSLILIACEGAKTEPKYFSFFEQIYPRKCKVEVLRNEKGTSTHKSAPKWLLSDIIRYKESNQVGEGDFLFIVSDVDRWEFKALYEIDQFCRQHKNILFTVSNPCFEVWLYYHVADPKLAQAKSSQQWKEILHNKTISGFLFEKYATAISTAVAKAKADDAAPTHFLPEYRHSKVYKVIEAIISKVGEGHFKAFTESFIK